MEILNEIWRFSLTPYGAWLWAIPAMIALAAWSDWREYRERRESIDIRIANMKRLNRRNRARLEAIKRGASFSEADKAPSGNDFGPGRE